MDVFPSIHSLRDGIDLIRRKRYGVIVAQNGRLTRIYFRPWPKVISIPEVGLLGSWRHRFRKHDECRVYFNQPLGHNSFLALRYLESGVGTSLQTVNVALAALDEIARIKGTDALLCDATNFRLSPRVMERYGWQAHKPQRWHRNYIKRFYGEYPALSAKLHAAIHGEEQSPPELRLAFAAETDTPPAAPRQPQPLTCREPLAALTTQAAQEIREDVPFDHHDDLVFSPQLRMHIQLEDRRSKCR